MTDLLRCVVGGGIQFAKVDYFDRVPTTDAHFVTAQGIPHDISSADNDASTPAAFELKPITKPLTRTCIELNYRVSAVQGLTLDEVIQSLQAHAKLFERTESSSKGDAKRPTCDALWQLVVVNTLGAWLSARNGWREYSPDVLGNWEFSMARFIFSLPDKLPILLEEESVPDLTKTSLITCCKFVYRHVSGHEEAHDEWIKGLAHNTSTTLHMMNFKEMRVDDDRNPVTRVRCNIPGSKDCVHINRSPITFWTHLLLQPGISTLPTENKSSVNEVLSYASMSLSRKNLELLRTQHKTTATAPLLPQKKRKRTEQTAEKRIIIDLKRVFGTYPDVLHPSRLRYTCYINDGVVCGHPRTGYHDSESSPLGVDQLLWDWIKEKNIDTPYVKNYALYPGPRLCMDSPKGTCTIPMAHLVGLKKKWFLDSISTNQGLLADVFIAPLLEHDDHSPAGCTTRLQCIQSSVEAFSLLCTTYTEVWSSIMALWPDVTLNEVHSAYTATKQQRLGYVVGMKNGMEWLTNPIRTTPEGWKVLINCARRLLQTDHTLLTVHAKLARDRLCINLGYTPTHQAEVQSYGVSSIELRDLGTDELTCFDSLNEYLFYCEYIIQSKLLWPIVRCWQYVHPHSIQSEASTNEKSAILCRMHAYILKEALSSQFLSFLSQITPSCTLSAFNKDILTVVLMALRHSPIPKTSLPLVSKIETILDTSSAQAREHNVTCFLSGCENRIRSMLLQRRTVDTHALVDIADKMCVIAPLLDPYPTITKLLLEIANDAPDETYPVLAEFKENRKSEPSDYLLDRIASHIHTSSSSSDVQTQAAQSDASYPQSVPPPPSPTPLDSIDIDIDSDTDIDI